MEVANLPALTNQSSLDLDKLRSLMVQGFEQGMSIQQLSLKLMPGRTTELKRARAKLRKQMWSMSAKDVQLHQQIAERAHAIMAAGLLPTTVAVVHRAGRGRMDAARVVLESTGFHNPKVQHEHSGEIKVTVDIPRPKFVEATSEDVA